MIYLATRRWRYKHVYIWSCVSVQGGTQVQLMKFGEDQTMLMGVVSFFVFHDEQLPVVEL